MEPNFPWTLGQQFSFRNQFHSMSYSELNQTGDFQVFLLYQENSVHLEPTEVDRSAE